MNYLHILSIYFLKKLKKKKELSIQKLDAGNHKITTRNHFSYKYCVCVLSPV